MNSLSVSLWAVALALIAVGGIGVVTALWDRGHPLWAAVASVPLLWLVSLAWRKG